MPNLAPTDLAHVCVTLARMREVQRLSRAVCEAAGAEMRRIARDSTAGTRRVISFREARFHMARAALAALAETCAKAAMADGDRQALARMELYSQQAAAMGEYQPAQRSSRRGKAAQRVAAATQPQARKDAEKARTATAENHPPQMDTDKHRFQAAGKTTAGAAVPAVRSPGDPGQSNQQAQVPAGMPAPDARLESGRLLRGLNSVAVTIPGADAAGLIQDAPSGRSSLPSSHEEAISRGPENRTRCGPESRESRIRARVLGGRRALILRALLARGPEPWTSARTASPRALHRLEAARLRLPKSNATNPLALRSPEVSARLAA